MLGIAYNGGRAFSVDLQGDMLVAVGGRLAAAPQHKLFMLKA